MQPLTLHKSETKVLTVYLSVSLFSLPLLSHTHSPTPTQPTPTEDERFLVKTMRKSEMKVLLDMLPAYAGHMEGHPHSLITRFFGLHKLRPLHGRSVSGFGGMMRSDG